MGRLAQGEGLKARQGPPHSKSDTSPPTKSVVGSAYSPSEGLSSRDHAITPACLAAKPFAVLMALCARRAYPIPVPTFAEATHGVFVHKLVTAGLKGRENNGKDQSYE